MRLAATRSAMIVASTGPADGIGLSGIVWLADAGRSESAILVHLDVRRLDDRRPARDLALDQREERRRPPLRLVGEVAAEHLHALARGLVVERLVERVGEFVDDRLRGFL